MNDYCRSAASWLIEYCHVGNFSFPVLVLKYLNMKNYLANVVPNCKIYSKELPVNDMNGISAVITTICVLGSLLWDTGL